MEKQYPEKKRKGEVIETIILRGKSLVVLLEEDLSTALTGKADLKVSGLKTVKLKLPLEIKTIVTSTLNTSLKRSQSTAGKIAVSNKGSGEICDFENVRGQKKWDYSQ